LRYGISHAGKLRRKVVRARRRTDVAYGRQPATQLPRTGADAVDAEEPVEERPGQREEPADDDPAEGAARIVLGQKRVGCRERGERHVQHQREQRAKDFRGHDHFGHHTVAPQSEHHSRCRPTSPRRL
jgi:hypothetical protein